MRSRYLFAAGAVTLSAALAAYFVTQTREPEIKPSQVLTWDCEYPAYKPETIMIYCGNGGAYISKINWDSWSKDGASGSGEYYRNLCEPDCADGKFVHAPVNLQLSDLTPSKGRFYFRTLDMTSANGKDFAWGESGVFQWDVMEFEKQMKMAN